MSTPAAQARRLVEHRDSHPVISLYLDLDPEHFATAPARASQIRSLLDAAARQVEEEPDLGHEVRIALREDCDRIKSFLASPQAPFKGARALAVFCSGPDNLFESIKLSRPVEAQVVIDRAPHIGPMVEAIQERRWLVALVNRANARLLTGFPTGLTEHERLDDDVHGQHQQGGWSQAHYERSVEKDVDDHLRQVAEVVNRRWREERFDRLALGGPQEMVPRFQEMLSEEARSRLAPGRVEVDISSATEADVRAAVDRLVEEDERQSEAAQLARLRDAVGAGGRGVVGVAHTVAALNERRVETLLLIPDFDQAAKRCSSCGLLIAEAEESCPADGSPLEEVPHLREAMVEAALVQDASVLVIRHHPDEAPFSGVGALLRF